MQRPHDRVSLMFLALFLLFVSALSAIAAGKKNDEPEKTSSEPPEYSDKDKQKMAEIARRPEVQEKIRKRWDEVRRRDMLFAYNVNSSTRMAQMLRSDWAEFREKYGELYDNPVLLQYVNSLGQRIVPKDSPNLYSFKLLLDPVPRAEALSTGTIFVSTGLVSLLDNEAQLSYVLAHETAHVEKQHAYNQVRNEIIEEELWKEKEADTQKKKTIFTAVAGAVGAGIGGAAAGGYGAAIGTLAGVGGGLIASHFIFRNRFEPTEWSKVQEDEADAEGLKYMLEQNYDAREVPRLYVRLNNMVSRDSRVGLGFVGSATRVRERTAHVEHLLADTYKPELERRMKDPGLTGSGPDFNLLMSALKRDNGIIALDYDLFAMAKDNLLDASNLRPNDPRVYYNLGRVVSLTGRTPEEKQQAADYYLRAVALDQQRGAYPEPHLQHALNLLAENNAAKRGDALDELKVYVTLYQREHAGQLPNNMHIIYDYLLLAGEQSWYVPPAAVVSTKNVEALNVTNTGNGSALSAPDVMKQAVHPAEQSDSKPTPKARNVSAPQKPTH